MAPRGAVGLMLACGTVYTVARGVGHARAVPRSGSRVVSAQLVYRRYDAARASR